jgi:hypothetical protein
MEGDIPGSCEELTLTFPGYDKVAYGAGYALLRGRSTNVFATLDVPTEVSGNTIKQPIKDIAKADVYTVTFPEGYFELGDDAISPEFKASFMVDPELLVDKTAVTDPANGAVVSPIDQITVTIPGTDFLNNSWNYKATISKDGGTPVELGETKYGEADNQIIQPLGGTAQEDGEYTVTFPAGFFVLGEDGDYESEEIVVKFTVLNVNTGIEENAIVETIEKLHIVYAGATKVTLTDVRATIKTADAEDVELDAASYDYDVYNAIYQPLKTKAAATYTVTFPAGYVKLTYPAEAAQGKVKTLANEGEIVKDSPEFTVTFTTTKECGISDLTVDSDSDAVYYNLNGVQIVNPTTGVYLIRRGNTVTKKVIK